MATNKDYEMAIAAEIFSSGRARHFRILKSMDVCEPPKSYYNIIPSVDGTQHPVIDDGAITYIQLPDVVALEFLYLSMCVDCSDTLYSGGIAPYYRAYRAALTSVYNKYNGTRQGTQMHNTLCKLARMLNAAHSDENIKDTIQKYAQTYDMDIQILLTLTPLIYIAKTRKHLGAPNTRQVFEVYLEDFCPIGPMTLVVGTFEVLSYMLDVKFVSHAPANANIYNISFEQVDANVERDLLTFVNEIIKKVRADQWKLRLSRHELDSYMYGDYESLRKKLVVCHDTSLINTHILAGTLGLALFIVRDFWRFLSKQEYRNEVLFLFENMFTVESGQPAEYYGVIAIGLYCYLRYEEIVMSGIYSEYTVGIIGYMLGAMSAPFLANNYPGNVYTFRMMEKVIKKIESI